MFRFFDKDTDVKVVMKQLENLGVPVNSTIMYPHGVELSVPDKYDHTLSTLAKIQTGQ